MLRRPLRFATAFIPLAFLTGCGAGGTAPSDALGSLGNGGSTTGTGGSSGSGTPGIVAGTTGNGTTTGSGGAMATGSGGSAVTGSAGTSMVTGNAGTSMVTGNAGTSMVTGNAGITSTVTGGGATVTGNGGTTSGAGVGTGGMVAVGGTSAVAGSGPDLDENGKANAAPGEMTSTAQDYIRLGEIRILNNNWGSEDLGCNAPMSVFVDQSSNFGWSFNRGDCDTQATNAKPDFPQIEFGIHPFGIGDERVTSPEFSSTTLLPIQIKDVQSMTVNIQNLNATFQQESSWNITFEFWISERNPLEPNPGVYAELMTFWGWQNGRWPAPPGGEGPLGTGAGNQVQSGGKSYTLWVQDDQWADGQWRYFQFRADDGPQKSFNGTLDVKPFIDYLVSSRQYSTDYWISRLEVGSEIDDMTQGTVQMSGISFEVNGESRAAIIGGN